MILKSEMKTEDMVSILEDLHSYVPTISTEHLVNVPGEDVPISLTADDFHHTLLGKAYYQITWRFDEWMYYFEGGDQLTATRVRGSQRVRSNSQRGCDRLEGLAPVVEDWHAKGCLLSVSSL